MSDRRARGARYALAVALSMALACAALGAIASSALAGGSPGRDGYTVNISPGSVPASSSTTFDVALTNTSSAGRPLIGAAITPPLGFRVTGASLPAGTRGNSYVLFNVVLLDHLSVAPGATLPVSVTAVAPSRCNTSFDRWLTLATGGVWGELLPLDPGSSLTTAVTCDTATGLSFSTQPADTLVGSAITGSAYNTSGSPVTVDLVDSSGNTVNSSAPVTIALGNNPGNATLGGTTTVNAVNGVATFNNLTLNEPDNGYTLTASSSGLPSSTSSSFDENTQEQGCTTGSDCTDTITSGSGSLQVDIPDPGSNSTLTLSTDVGTPMDGTGSNPKLDPGCSDYNPPEGSADWYEFVETPPAGGTYDAKNITWTVSNGASVEGFEICFGAPYDFQTGFNDDGAPIYAPAGTLPTGVQGYVGLLDSCNDLGDAESSNPCWTSIVPTVSYTGVVASVQIPAGLSGDPLMGR